MNNLKNIINEKKNNIGALCIYIKKREYLEEQLEKYLIDNKIEIELTLSQKIWCYDNSETNILCGCGKMKKWKDFKSGWRITCGNKNCINNKRKETNISVYGCDNPLKNEKIREKVELTNIKKYGVSVASKNQFVKEKISKVLQNRDNIHKEKTKKKKIESWKNKNEDDKKIIRLKRKDKMDRKTLDEKKLIDSKRKKTCLNRYGSEYAISSKEIRNKIEKIFMKKYGGKSPFSNEDIVKKSIDSYKNGRIEEIKNKLNDFNVEYVSHINKNSESSNIEYVLKCKRTNNFFKMSYTNLRVRLISKSEISPFFREKKGTSDEEERLFNFIKEIYVGEIIKNTKNIISPLELDIYLPELKLAFEFNGLFWHNELNKSNNYHLEKTELAEKQGIKLVHIYEDDWMFKQEIVKSRILNLLNKTPNKIYARKCEIKEVFDNKLVREFLENNHIQGFVGSKIKIGLFYSGELVSLMTFGSLRRAMGQNSHDGSYEMLRFCNKLNTNVIGGASRLFKFFVKNFEPKEVTSYADRSWSQGDLYKNLGFELIRKTEPNYYYVIDGVRRHRFGFRKDHLVKEGFDPLKTEHEIMLDRKIYRIYDSGNLKFIKNL